MESAFLAGFDKSRLRSAFNDLCAAVLVIQAPVQRVLSGTGLIMVH
jgi:hypothetical protein